jgi:hypothetical protein
MPCIRQSSGYERRKARRPHACKDSFLSLTVALGMATWGVRRSTRMIVVGPRDIARGSVLCVRVGDADPQAAQGCDRVV